MQNEGAVMRSRTSFYLLVALTLVLGATGFSASSYAAQPANLSGLVIDAHGIPQAGAVVQLISNATTIATAFTDDRGRYSIHAVIPGSYQLRATAAFFLPTAKQNVRLLAGAQAVINLTMNTMAEASSWLPAQRRRADEPADDWKWTLRSVANRPLLRVLDDAEASTVSSSAERNRRAQISATVAVTSGDGGFGQGGMHHLLLLDRSLLNGDGTVMRADVSGSRSPYPVAPSAELVLGYEHRDSVGNATRLVTSVQSHPELTNGTTTGAQIMRIASTHQFKLGDSVLVDAGSLLKAERIALTRMTAEPFLRVAFRPGVGTLIEYRFASGQELQSSDDLDQLKPALRLATDTTGKPLSTKGTHNELSFSKKLGTRVVQVSAYTDHRNNVILQGGGDLDARDITQGSLLSDPTTNRFSLGYADVHGRGLSVSMEQPLTPALSMWFGYDLGTALMANSGDPMPLADALRALKTRTSYAATGALRGKIARTGTNLRAEYRWQPEQSLTQVNAFNVGDRGAYLGIYVRQRLWRGRLIPDGIDAVIEATNLLEQGYQPVLAADGRLMFLAQTPRSFQGGLAFTF
jgi:hypothetical protein